MQQWGILTLLTGKRREGCKKIINRSQLSKKYKQLGMIQGFLMSQNRRLKKSIIACLCFLIQVVNYTWGMCVITPLVMLSVVISVCWGKMFYNLWDGMRLACRLKMRQCNTVFTLQIGRIKTLTICVISLNNSALVTIGIVS